MYQYIVANQLKRVNNNPSTYRFFSSFQTKNVESFGTCTMRELYGIMVRVGSDLFSFGKEEFEALAAQCSVFDT